MTEPDAAAIAATKGAQVVLPPDSAASLGAKGVFPTIQENTDHRDAGYVEMGYDPVSPSAHETDDRAAPPVEAAPTPPPAETMAGGTGA